jgi:hypothetical protein
MYTILGSFYLYVVHPAVLYLNHNNHNPVQHIFALGSVVFKARSRDRFPVVSHWGFYSVATDGTMCPGVDSASKNEYEGFRLGVKAAGASG